MISFARPFKLGVLLAAALVLAIAVASQAPRPAHAVFQDSDGDTVIDLAEVTTGSNPNDATSVPESTEAIFASGVPLCTDGVDNDRDGLTDAADTGCTDSDNDIISNATELFLGSDPYNSASFPEDSRFDVAADDAGFPLYWCGDRLDNDGDGFIDSADPGCAPIQNDGDAFDDATEKRYGSDPANPNSVPEHELANPGSCSDAIDNDRDSMTDSADPACTIPANDDRANATSITTLPYTDGPVVLKNATVQPGERAPSCSYGSIYGTVWYRYTPASDTVVIADTFESNFNTVIAAWTEVNSRLQEVACDYGYTPPSSGQARIAFRATGGQTYYIQVDGSPVSSRNSLPSLTFHLTSGAPPANDQFQDATMIGTLPFSSSVTTDNATTQAGEPHPFCSYDTLTSTVWYKFAPASDALVVLDTAGSDFQPVVQAYVNTKFGLAPLACAAGQPPGVPLPTPDITPAKIALQAQAGQTYYIQVSGSGFGISFGHLSFHAAAGVPPANDNFANARAIGSLPYTDTVDVLTGSVEDGEPTPMQNCAYSPAGPTVWYRYTASVNGGLAVNTEGSNFSSFVVVYQGPSLDQLTPLACGNPYNFGYTALGIQVTAGQTYYIQAGSFGTYIGPLLGAVGGKGGGFGFGGSQLVLNVEVLDIPSCPAARYTYTDPTGDTIDRGFPPGLIPPVQQQDISAVHLSTSSQSVCVTVDLNNHIDPPDAATGAGFLLSISFDGDSNLATGYPSDLDYACTEPAQLGTDLGISTYSTAGIIVPFYSQLVPPPLPGTPVATGENYAILLLHDRSAQLIVPLAALGGDNTFDFALYVGSPNYGASDCAPNGGHITCVRGECQLTQSLLGDANCDGRVNAIDAALVLQLNAGLLQDLPCRAFADANQNGSIGPVDATLILQYSSGMLPALPVARG